MDEEKENQQSTENTNEGSITETADVIKRADAAAERLEQANKKQEELLQRQEALHAKQILSGRADAGQARTKPVEETPEEYADKILKGEANPFGD